jgi:hypothetical protein
MSSNPPISPGFVQGQTLPANQLNQLFMGKQDYPAITQPLGTSDTTIATTAFVNHAIVSISSAVTPFPTVAAVQAANIPIGTPGIETFGYYVYGDGGGARYILSPTQVQSPALPGNIQSADGQWWQYLPASGVNNIKVFGAKGDGVTDDSAAFLAFNTWAQTYTGQVVLIIPPGTYRLSNTLVGPTQLRGGADFYRGIKDLVISGYGASLTSFARLMPYQTSPPAGEVNLATVRINVVSAGSTTVTAKAAWPAGAFNVGDWVTVASLEMLGDAGAPPTWYYFEYCKIASINTSTNTLTFVDPLMNTHLDTYPQTTNPAHVAGQADPGGPATVFAMTQDWDQSVKVMGVTFQTISGQSDSHFNSIFTMACRRGEFVDCSVANPLGGPYYSLFCSTCQDMIYERCKLGQFFEPDKNIGVLKLINCSIIGPSSVAEFTSMSYEKLVIDGCHFPGTLEFISKNTEIKNSNIGTMILQGPGQGIPHTCIIDNCHVGVLQPFNRSFGYLLLSNLSFSNGRFSISKSLAYNTYRLVFGIVTPGQKMFIGQSGNSSKNFGNPFIVTALGEDATTVWFDTTLAMATLPTYTSSIGVPDIIVQHPCSRITARNVTGDRQAVQISKAIPELPLYSYIHNVYGQNLAFPVQSLAAWGTLVSITINVITADTGPNVTLTMRPCGANGAWVVNTSNVTSQYNPVIDLKTVGKRVITPTSVAGSVGADAIGAAPGAIWFMDVVINPWLSASVVGQTAVQMPLVEIEVITDQGVTKLAYNALAHQ